MKALVLVANGRLEFENIQMPQKSRESSYLIKVSAAGGLRL